MTAADPHQVTTPNLAQELTILTVSYNSSRQIELNQQLFNKLNPGVNCRWVIVENSPLNSSSRVTPGDKPNTDIFEGVKPYNPKLEGAGSYHHGDGLNLGFRQIDTRYALILDPDFYITQPEWVKSVISYMQEQKLAFLGAPWNPDKPTKIRYFPAVHCTFIDRGQIDTSHIDFKPDFENEPGYLHMKELRKSSLGKNISKIIHPKRLRIGSCRDTGWKLYNQYKHSLADATECFQPVFHPSRSHQAVDSFLPDAYRLTPKPRGYTTEIGYESIGHPEIGQYGWEEFIWNNAPFGFHLRSSPIRSKGGENEHLHRLEQLLRDW